jgi:hypothetical protein
MTTEPRTIYLLRVAAPSGAVGLHALRALLKRLLRQHGFRALDVREENDAATGDVNTTPAGAGRSTTRHRR